MEWVGYSVEITEEFISKTEAPQLDPEERVLLASSKDPALRKMASFDPDVSKEGAQEFMKRYLKPKKAD